MQVKDVMTTPAITVREDASLHDVAEMLAAQRVSGLPVVDPGRRTRGRDLRGGHHPQGSGPALGRRALPARR